MLKRNADWLEKMSVAAMAVGVFQKEIIGIVIGILCYMISMAITKHLGGPK
jgi:hypothetical protein